MPMREYHSPPGTYESETVPLLRCSELFCTHRNTSIKLHSANSKCPYKDFAAQRAGCSRLSAALLLLLPPAKQSASYTTSYRFSATRSQLLQRQQFRYTHNGPCDRLQRNRYPRTSKITAGTPHTPDLDLSSTCIRLPSSPLNPFAPGAQSS